MLCSFHFTVSCTLWEKREVKKAELSVLDISSAIIARVEGMPENFDYFYGGKLIVLPYYFILQNLNQPAIISRFPFVGEV